MKAIGVPERHRYRVGTTANGHRVEFTVEATTGEKAVAEARRQARKDGLQRITVNYVSVIPDTDNEDNPDYTVSQEQQGGPYSSTGSSDFDLANCRATKHQDCPWMKSTE